MATWDEKIDNPDPRIQWAMKVLDQEGEDFEGVTGKLFTPMSWAAAVPGFNTLHNMMSRQPLRTNLFGALLLMPASAFIGIQIRNFFDNQRSEEEAMIRHYIMTHPERFPEPKKVKYIDHIEPWIAKRV